VQIDSKARALRDEDAILKKFGVPPILIPDFLAIAAGVRTGMGNDWGKDWWNEDDL
jgi:hypothetical protein